MKKQDRGKAESSWPVARRCLALLLRLQAGPAKKQALLEAVYRYAGEDAYGFRTGKPLDQRFRGDLGRLADNLQVGISYSSAEKGYVIKWRERPLLNLLLAIPQNYYERE